jgi:hypothetical protein
LVTSTQDHCHWCFSSCAYLDDSLVSSDDSLRRNVQASKRISIQDISSGIVDHKLGAEVVHVFFDTFYFLDKNIISGSE